MVAPTRQLDEQYISLQLPSSSQANATFAVTAAVSHAGWLVGCSFGYAGATNPKPGRYYGSVALLYGGVGIRLWRGYIGTAADGSMPNIYVEEGQNVRLNVYTGTNAVASDLFVCSLDYSAAQPVGGAYLHDEPPFAGPGEIVSESISAPSAGAQQTYTIPAQVRQRFISYKGSIAVANSGSARPVSYVYTDGTNTTHVLFSAFFGTAAINATQNLELAEEGLNNPPLATPVLGPWVNRYYPAAYTFGTNIGSLVAGDQVNAARLVVEEWAGPTP